MLKTILFIILMFFLEPATAQSYLWPTGASGDISSNFGEFREDHFHMGIDIKTNGKTGYPVYAIEDGHISRIVTNYRGYGRAVYLTMEDGKTATYAHLDRFSDEVQKVVFLNQKKQMRYGLDLQFKKTKFPVNRGDIIGFTGNSGNSFGPHLHFELRNALQQPLNPFTSGIPFADTRNPILHEMAFIPLYPGSRVNGNPLPQTFELFMDRDGTYFFPDTINVDGTFGIALRAADRREGVENQYQIHSAELIIDGQTVYKVTYDLLDFNQSGLMNSVHDNRLARLNLGSFQNLYRSPAIPHISIMDSSRTGILDLSPGYHALEISVTDHSGNEARFRGTLIQYPTTDVTVVSMVENGPYTTINVHPVDGRAPLTKATVYSFTPYGYPEKRIAPLNTIRDSLGLKITVPTSALKRHIFQITGENSLGAFGFPVHVSLADPGKPLDGNIQLRFSVSEGGLYIQAETYRYIHGDVSIRIIRGNIATPVPLLQVQPTVYLSELLNPAILNRADRIEIRLRSPDGADRIVRHRIKPVFIPEDSERLVLSNDNNCSVRTFPTTLYKPSIAWIETVEKPAEIPESGSIVSGTYQLQPFELAIRDTFQVAIRLDEKKAGMNRVHLYYYDNREESWSFLKTERKRDNSVLIAAHDRFDAITAIQDTLPPEIKWSFPAHGSRYKAQDIYLIKVILSDNLSGLDPTEESLAMQLDETRLLPAYQPIQKELTYELDGHLTSGEHKIDLFMRDKAGNINTESIVFFVD